MGRKQPVTRAIHALRDAGIEFTEHPYDYADGGGTTRFAKQTGVDEHAVIKTLVMVDECGHGLLVLMHGDREVSTKALARALGVKSVAPVDPAAAHRMTGYQVGGISPFGTRKPLPVCMESTIVGLPKIYINGGRRGLLVRLAPADLVRVLDPTHVEAAR
ncbi:MAG: Cys-tRNA(Pro) deacylase [Gammaproteobacteria bacterium]|nr:MAG: Cys-tRNA(Pro) deacylase [Gammaproteobacteria bacterium]